MVDLLLVQLCFHAHQHGMNMHRPSTGSGLWACLKTWNTRYRIGTQRLAALETSGGDQRIK